jgi:DNA replication protein DnaC
MNHDNLLQRAIALKLHGVIKHWEEAIKSTWLETLLQWEENTRTQRSLDRRLAQARLGRFKLMADFDWSWPKQCDREIIEECLQLSFINTATNVILCGPNGVGKSTIARNIAYQAVLQGHTVLFTTAGEMLNDVASQDGDLALKRRIKHYVQPAVLVIDEVGYLSYSNRHADILFEIISRRYQQRPTLITTNKPFSEWAQIFPNAACVVSLVDRLVHHSEIITILADSFRLKEANEAKAKRELARTKNKPKKTS